MFFYPLRTDPHVIICFSVFSPCWILWPGPIKCFTLRGSNLFMTHLNFWSKFLSSRVLNMKKWEAESEELRLQEIHSRADPASSAGPHISASQKLNWEPDGELNKKGRLEFNMSRQRWGEGLDPTRLQRESNPDARYSTLNKYWCHLPHANNFLLIPRTADEPVRSLILHSVCIIF